MAGRDRPRFAAGPAEAARPAQASDVGELWRLHRDVLDALRTRRGGAALRAELVQLAETPEALDRLVAHRDHLVVVGTLDDVIVGYGLASLDRLEAVAHVAAVYVEPEARQVGVGGALLDVLTSLATARGCARIDVDALPGDRALKSLLETLGYRARLVVLARCLDPGQA